MSPIVSLKSLWDPENLESKMKPLSLYFCIRSLIHSILHYNYSILLRYFHYPIPYLVFEMKLKSLVSVGTPSTVKSSLDLLLFLGQYIYRSHPCKFSYKSQEPRSVSTRRVSPLSNHSHFVSLTPSYIVFYYHFCTRLPYGSPRNIPCNKVYISFLWSTIIRLFSIILESKFNSETNKIPLTWYLPVLTYVPLIIRQRSHQGPFFTSLYLIF